MFFPLNLTSLFWEDYISLQLLKIQHPNSDALYV